MSIVFSKNKEKRSRSSSSGANNSFVKNVTSRVSGLLPATITKWFSSPSQSSANGSAPKGDASDSEDDRPDSPVIAQPPTKRMRYSSPNKCNHFNLTDANITDVHLMEQYSPYHSIQSPPNRVTFSRDTKYISTPLRPIERPIIEESTIERVDKDNISIFQSQEFMSSIVASVAAKRKAMFDHSHIPISKDVSVKPCVKKTSNITRDPKPTIIKSSSLGSSFYPGKTNYGGASVSSYLNQPIRLKRKPKAFVNKKYHTDNNISQSAKRILDLLEDYASPLDEAKRMPAFARRPVVYPPINNKSGTIYGQVPKSYKLQELYVPRVASIMQIKHRSRLVDATTAARQIIASHSSTLDCSPYPTQGSPSDQAESESSNKLTTKVKSRVTRAKRGDNIDVETSMPDPVNLPSVVLQIDKDKLPNFDFEVPPVSKPSPRASSNSVYSLTETTTHVTETKTSTKLMEPSRKPDIVSSSNPYKFASPVRISSESPHDTSTPPKFKFCSPERSIEKMKINERKDVDSSCVVGSPKENDIKAKHTVETKYWLCPSCWVYNMPNLKTCGCCTRKKPIKCSDCKNKSEIDLCANCEKINNISTTKDPSRWQCDFCWVQNEESAQKCISCSRTSTKGTVGRMNPLPLNILTNDAESDWKCDDCWIKNKSNVNKCIACGGANPNPRSSIPEASPSTFTNIKQTDDSFKVLIKAQTEKWECPNCLVRNESDKYKCICCEADKPGSVKKPEVSFNFGTNTSFKFGIDPKVQESRLDDTGEMNFAIDENFEESETNNNILPKTPTFTFGLPAKKSEDQIDTSKKLEDKTESAPKINLLFGIPKPLPNSAPPPTVPVVTPIFGGASKLLESTPKVIEEKERLQEVPTITFTIPNKTDTSKLLFTSPVSLKAKKDKKISRGLLLKASRNFDKREAPSNSLALQPITTINESKQQPTFAFSATEVKPGVNLFAPLATAGATTSSPFASSLQNAPVTTTASLFQKSDPTPARMPIFPKSDSSGISVPVFQNSDTVASTVPPSLGAPAPLFSFGNNTQPVLPQPDKPKFNFTFGNNSKPEMPGLFKPTFGAPADNANSNKFNLGAGNALGAGSTLVGNGLSSNNVLSPGNGLPTNTLGGVSEMLSTPLLGGNGLQTGNALTAPSGGIFGGPVQKENIWAATNNNPSNPFVSNAAPNNLPKPAFTFGSSTPFSAPNVAPAFGAPSAAPIVFGMPSQSTNNTMFSAPVQSGQGMFGQPQPASALAPTMGMFGSPNVGPTPTFGTPNPPMPSFEAPSLTPAPAFNFGSPQPTGIFGFGQQQPQPQQQQPAAAGVYSFGNAPAAGPQVQFNMGSAPNAALGVRRVRKAVRRNTTPR